MKLRLFQIDSEKDAIKKDSHRCIFRDFNPEHFYPEIYESVYEGELDIDNLEDAYVTFNLRTEVAYDGRSLSTSDIVEVLEDAGETKAGLYYCNSVGWEKIEAVMPITDVKEEK